MNVACPACSTVYRIDPARVPAGGVGTRCRECGTAFRVDPAPTQAPGAVATAARIQRAGGTAPAGGQGAGVADPLPEAEPEAPPEAAPAPAPESAAPVEPAEPLEPTQQGTPPSPAPSAPAFGPQDPGTRARRLARALVSDIKVYSPEKWEESREAGTLRKAFRDEILKSWEEYVEQVGEEMAKRTPYFRDALNDILASGDRVF